MSNKREYLFYGIIYVFLAIFFLANLILEDFTDGNMTARVLLFIVTGAYVYLSACSLSKLVGGKK